MVESFPRTLSNLRKEKKISQKEAAASLGISQALLSHYENGLREPGLEFAVNAAAYYGVTTDYLLGASEERTVIEKSPAQPVRENLSQTPKRLAVNSLSLLFDAVAGSGSSKLASELSAAVSLAIYRLLRLFAHGAQEPPASFVMAENEAGALVDAELLRTQARLERLIAQEAGQNAIVDGRIVRESYPVYEHSLRQTVKLAEERVKKLTEL